MARNKVNLRSSAMLRVSSAEMMRPIEFSESDSNSNKTSSSLNKEEIMKKIEERAKLAHQPDENLQERLDQEAEALKDWLPEPLFYLASMDNVEGTPLFFE